MTSLKENYVLVTGATSGIGYELAKLFAEHNYNLIIVARTGSKLNKVATDFSTIYGVNVVPITKDLFEKEAPFEVYEEIIARGLRVNIVVNDAGQSVYGKFIDTDIQRELDIIQLNINAYVVLTKLFLRDMINNGYGKILNVASIAGKVPGPLQSIYHGTKAFVHSFTEAIRAETEDSGIIITSLLPGLTDTDIFNKAGMQESKILEVGLAEPAQVARDGFNALMNGDDMVISGLKNKAQVGISNLIPDHILAKKLLKALSPRDKY